MTQVPYDIDKWNSKKFKAQYNHVNMALKRKHNLRPGYLRDIDHTSLIHNYIRG